MIYQKPLQPHLQKQVNYFGGISYFLLLLCEPIQMLKRQRE